MQFKKSGIHAYSMVPIPTILQNRRIDAAFIVGTEHHINNISDFLCIMP